MASRLRRFGIEPDAIEAEVQAMHPVVVAPTVNRSVLGIMVDFAKAVAYYSGDLRTDERRHGSCALKIELAARG